MRTRAGVAIAIAIGSLAAARSAPDPIGVYAIVEQAVFEPPTGAPARVQLWGAFALAESTHEFYAAPKRGYMYFTCASDLRDRCDADWADLRWHAGSGKAIGFGDRAKPLGRIRPGTESLAAPDPYPAGEAVIKMASKDYPEYTALADKLKAALK